MARFYDFDAYIRERNKTRGVSFTLFDQTFYLSPTIPFDAALLLQSLSGRSSDENLDSDTVIQIFKKLVGEEIYQTICKNPQFDVDLMVSVMSWILEQYGLSKGTEQKKEEAADLTAESV